MSGNRSLDEFADAGAGTDDAPDEAADGPEDPAVTVDEAAAPDAEPDSAASDERASDGEQEPPPGDESISDDEMEPPTVNEPDSDGDATADGDAIGRPASTYAWHPDGEPCAACGTAVEERWRDGDDLVCADCKEW